MGGLAFVVSPFIGSFLGVLIRRLPREAPVVLARSECETCGRRLRWWEMLPVASYAGLRGRCARCGAAISPMHPAVELAAASLAVWAWAADSGRVWTDCVLGWALLALAWIDWEHFWLPDTLTLPLVLAGLADTWWEAPWAVGDHALGAALGWALLWSVGAAFERVRGYPGLGEGDAKLFAASGAWLGWQALPWVLTGAAVAGIALALARGARGREPVPFGPCIAAATWIVRLHGAG